MLLFFFSAFPRLSSRLRRKKTTFQRRKLFFLLSNSWLQNLSANFTSLLTLPTAVYGLRDFYHERPWMLPRTRIGWFEVMHGDHSQSRYWKEHFTMGKTSLLRLVALVAPETSEETRGCEKLSLHLTEWLLLCGGSLEKGAFAMCAASQIGFNRCS